MTKYIDRNPKTAKIFELNAINGSLVIARTAGTESRANIRSAFSITKSYSASGVINNLLFLRKNNSPFLESLL